MNKIVFFSFLFIIVVMNVLYVSHRGELGGGELSLIEIIRKIKEYNVIPYVLIPPNTELLFCLRKILPESNILELELTSINFKYFSKVKCIKKFIKDNNIDIIHTNTTRSTLYTIFLSKFFKIPLFWHNRGSDKRGVIEYFLAKNVTKSISISNYVKNQILKLGIKKSKVETVYNGINIDDTYIKKYNFIDIENKTDIKIGLIGRFTKEKGHLDSLIILKYLLNKNKNYKLYFVGSDNFGESNFELIKLKIKKMNLENNIEFLGYKTDILKEINGFDVVIVPSQREAFGRVILEAWNVGVPIIAYSVDGIKELIEHNKNGLLVEPYNKIIFVNAVIKLVNNNLLYNNLIKSGFDRLNSFSSKKMIKKIFKLYSENLFV